MGKKGKTHSHVVQDTPAAVGVTGAQTLGTCSVLLTRLHRDLSHLKQSDDRRGQSAEQHKLMTDTEKKTKKQTDNSADRFSKR